MPSVKQMSPRYQNTQIGYATLAFGFGALIVGALPFLVLNGFSGTPGFWLSVSVPGLTFFLFHSLTVRVEGDKLIWYFGPRFWRNTLSLHRIKRVDVVRNSPLHGWGIRMIRNGWLYNVSGLDAVEVTTTDGDVIRIGTDEPAQLATVLRDDAERCVIRNE